MTSAAELADRIARISPTGWTEPFPPSGQHWWVTQAARKIVSLLGSAPITFVTGTPSITNRHGDRSPGTVVAFTDSLLVLSRIGAGDPDSTSIQVSAQAVSRDLLIQLEIDPDRAMDEEASGSWPAGADLIATYYRIGPLRFPMTDNCSAAHRAELFEFLPSLLADLGAGPVR